MHNGFLWQLLLHPFGIVAFHSAVTAHGDACHYTVMHANEIIPPSMKMSD
jgi:hypothetical protein